MTPDLIERAIRMGATNPPGKSLLHGDEHWRCVAIAGLEIARNTPNVDPEFILTFAMLHDIMREDDWDDAKHGERAADLFIEMCDLHPDMDYFVPGSEQAAAMHYTLHNHTSHKNYKGDNPNIGACWDADRVNLWRVGITPDPKFLSTEFGSTTYMRKLGYELCLMMGSYPIPKWEHIIKKAEELRTA